MKDVSYCEGLPCIPNPVPPSIRRSLYLSPRQSAPSSPPNCCLMVQLLCNTLEHRLRDQGSCDGSLSLLNQKKREEHKKNKVLQRRTFICHGWMDYCKKYKFGCLLPRLFSFKPVSCEETEGTGAKCRFSQSCLHTLVLCSISRANIYNSRLPLQCATHHL